jgi:hypothetical protein
MKNDIVFGIILLAILGMGQPVLGQTDSRVPGLNNLLLLSINPGPARPWGQTSPVFSGLEGKQQVPALAAGKAPKKKQSRARRLTFWTITTLGVTYGTLGLLSSLGAAGEHTEYMDAVISYDAQKLGDDMQKLQEKAYSQLTMSAFFLIISTMMAMDLEYGGY